MEIINDKEMKEEIITDLINNRGYTHDEAEDWVKEHGESLVNEMWNEYSNYIEMNSEYKKENEE